MTKYLGQTFDTHFQQKNSKYVGEFRAFLGRKESSPCCDMRKCRLFLASKSRFNTSLTIFVSGKTATDRLSYCSMITKHYHGRPSNDIFFRSLISAIFSQYFGAYKIT